MAIINVPAPILDNSLQQALLAAAQPLAAGLQLGQQRRSTSQDLSSLLAFNQATQQFQQQGQRPGLEQIGQTSLGGQLPVSQATGQPFIDQPQMPRFQSQLFQGLGGQAAIQQAFGQPTQRAPSAFGQTQAEINRISAIPKADRTVTEQARLDQLLDRKPPTGFKVVDKLVDDPQSPTGFSVEQFDQAGKSIGRRTATQKEVLQGVPEGALQRPTQTKIEKDIIDLNTTLAELDEIEKQINSDFFTFRGKGKAFFTALGEKLEIPVPQAAKKFLGEKTTFFADSKRVFLKFRKFITGVAGGITEFKEIQKAAIDPEGDSETEFRNKFNSMRYNALRTKNVSTLNKLIAFI